MLRTLRFVPTCTRLISAVLVALVVTWTGGPTATLPSEWLLPSAPSRRDGCYCVVLYGYKLSAGRLAEVQYKGVVPL